MKPEHRALLDRWLEGDCSAEELRDLEALMSINADFKTEVQAYESLMTGLNGLALDEMETNLCAWESKHRPNLTVSQTTNIIPLRPTTTFTQKFLSTMKKYWIAAALVLAAMPLGYWLMSGSVTPDALFSDNFKAEEMQPHISWNRGGSVIPPKEEGEVAPETPAETPTAEESRAKALLNSGIGAYNSAKYADAAGYFEAYLEGGKVSNDREVRFYLGVSYLAQNQPGKAKPLFRELSQQPFSIGFESLRQSSEWYLALAMLKDGEPGKAKHLLGKIAADGKEHAYAEQAKAMLAKMEKHRIG